jgi:hypothetical protein
VTFNTMTDHPRFEPIRSAPDLAHLDYNGGRLVDAMLRLVECWLALRESKPPGLRGSADEALPRRPTRNGSIARAHCAKLRDGQRVRSVGGWPSSVGIVRNST